MMRLNTFREQFCFVFSSATIDFFFIHGDDQYMSLCVLIATVFLHFMFKTDYNSMVTITWREMCPSHRYIYVDVKFDGPLRVRCTPARHLGTARVSSLTVIINDATAGSGCEIAEIKIFEEIG